MGSIRGRAKLSHNLLPVRLLGREQRRRVSLECVDKVPVEPPPLERLNHVQRQGKTKPREESALLEEREKVFGELEH